MSTLSHLQVRNSKDDETPIESATQIFASIFPSHTSFFKMLFSSNSYLSFEIFLLSQTIYFYVTAPSEKETFVSSLISSSYPNVKITKTTDPLSYIIKSPVVSVGELALSSYYYMPLKTYIDFRDIDPLSSVLGFLARTPPEIKMGIQILCTPATFPWQKNATKVATSSVMDEKADRYVPNAQKMIINRKTAFQGGKVLMRLTVGGPTKDIAQTYLSNLAGTFGAFSLGEGNQLGLKKPGGKKDFLNRCLARTTGAFEHRSQILNAAECATLWHLPGLTLAGVKNIAWGKALSGEPPENLPISDIISAEDKKDYNFFGKTEFKNAQHIFGIKSPDRRKHFYIIGKTGTGKSTLIANMAIDDIRRDRGIGIIDPHGDLSSIILDYIPKRRVNDVVYLEPFDMDRPFHLNVLEVKNKTQRELVASGIVSIFFKLYGNSWGPRLEYILRNTILTLLEIEGTTLTEVLSILSNQDYRKKVISQLTDPVLKNFWVGEFEKMNEKLRTEAVSPIQNKVGQFVTSRMIRGILGHPKSTIDLVDIMDNQKILILNLSQGKLGEDNASLLGAMMITQIQLAAMGRSYTNEEDRRDFFLYVDEFQNFATSSFVKILSEARKYRLSLILANQYIEQLDETVSKAIFGNVGSLMTFVVGSRDARMLSLEFGEQYAEADLVSLGKFETIVKLSVDGQTSSPFPANTLPLPSLKNDNKDKIITLSKEKYGRKADVS